MRYLDLLHYSLLLHGVVRLHFILTTDKGSNLSSPAINHPKGVVDCLFLHRALFCCINKIIPYQETKKIGILFPPNYLDVAARVVTAQPQLCIAQKYLYLPRSRRVIIFLASDSGGEKTNTS